MAESKKRAADSEGLSQTKKPKFEKKVAFKNDTDNKTNKFRRPVQKPGKFELLLLFCFILNVFFIIPHREQGWNIKQIPETSG